MMGAQLPQPPIITPEDYLKKIFSAKLIMLYLAVAVLAYGAIYYFFLSGKEGIKLGKKEASPGIEAQGPAGEFPEGPVPVIVNLNAQNNSAQDGLALIAEENGKVKLSISLGNAGTTAQPAHIHTGKCGQVGDVKYPLNDIVEGQSETTINATLSEIRTGSLAINVHKSQTEVKEYTSCGDIPVS